MTAARVHARVREHYLCGSTQLCALPTSQAQAFELMPTQLLAASGTDISPIFLATATGSLLFVFLVVATIVINFGAAARHL